MADEKIYNKVITIESKEESKTTNGNTMVKITDHTGEKFNFFKKKKDGELSSPAAQFRDMDLDEGSTVRIGYVIETYQDKKGVTRESHKIINFQETNENPSQTAPQPQKPRSEAPISSGGASNDEFGRRLAVHGLVNAMLANPNLVQHIDGQGDIKTAKIMIEYAIEVENEINKQLNPSKFRQTVQKVAPQVAEPDLPTIQQDEAPPISDDDLPPF